MIKSLLTNFGFDSVDIMDKGFTMFKQFNLKFNFNSLHSLPPQVL